MFLVEGVAHLEIPNVYQRWKSLADHHKTICLIFTETCNKKLVFYFTPNDLAAKKT